MHRNLNQLANFILKCSLTASSTYFLIGVALGSVRENVSFIHFYIELNSASFLSYKN